MKILNKHIGRSGFIPFNLFIRTISMIALVVFFSCSKDDLGSDPGPNPIDSSVNDYLKDLPSWENFSPTLANVDFIPEAIPEFDCDNSSIQSTSECSITQTPEEIVTHDPGSEILYLGSLIQGNGYIGGLGSIKSLPIYQRAPLSVTIDFQMSNNSRTVDNPNLTTVKQAVAELVEAADNAGHNAGSSIFYNEKTSHSLKQTAIALGLSYKFMKGEVKTQLAWTSTQETNTVSAYFKQKMFTVSMGIPQRPGDVFNSTFTKALLDEQINMGRIGPDNLPVYVSNIVYGRMMMLTMTSTYTETEMKAALDATNGSFDVGMTAEHLSILSESDIKLVTIGGEAAAALGYLRTGEIKEFFKNDAPLTTAVPISYTLRNLGDNDVATVSETTEYIMEQYQEISDEDIFTQNSSTLWSSEVENSTTASPAYTLVEWTPTHNNVLQADEAADFVLDTGSDQLFMFKHITLPGSKTGYPFDFYLKNMDPDPVCQADKGALVLNDKEIVDGHWVGQFTDYPNNETISIGDVGNFEDDNFEIGVTSDNVYAIGITVAENTHESSEWFEVYAVDASGMECQVLHTTDYINGFYGIVSPLPIKRIYFNESSLGDDIGISTIYFGYK